MSEIKTITIPPRGKNTPLKKTIINYNTPSDTNISDKKNIVIQGTNNRYLMKRVLREEKSDGKIRTIKNKKDSEIISQEISNKEQLSYLKFLKSDEESKNPDIKKLILKEIKTKIKSYKNQDLKKNKFNDNFFISEEEIIKKMIQCNLKCIYCNNELLILYNKVREMSQWTIDRIDNEEGHNDNNFCISCLECNLNRRCRDYDKYLLGKQIQNIEKGNI